MHAEPGVVLRLAGAVEDWPRILPHYRWVCVLADDGHGQRIVEMAARRDVFGRIGWPLRWTARQIIGSDRVEFVHIAGITRGMEVAWTCSPAAGGATTVRIRHVFKPAWPVPALLVRLIVGEYFVNSVARRTLGRIAILAEVRTTPVPEHS
jgi:hypothetical protein